MEVGAGDVVDDHLPLRQPGAVEPIALDSILQPGVVLTGEAEVDPAVVRELWVQRQTHEATLAGPAHAGHLKAAAPSAVDPRQPARSLGYQQHPIRQEGDRPGYLEALGDDGDVAGASRPETDALLGSGRRVGTEEE